MIEDIARDLEQIERQLATSWRKGDCDAWGGLLAPDWSVIHINGEVMTKTQALDMCRAQQTPIEAMNVDELSVRAFTDAAVVTGRTTVTVGGTNPEIVKLRFTDFFIRSSGRWLVAASHATRIA